MTLTPEQIENWRRVVGLLPVEAIEMIHHRIQMEADQIARDEERKAKREKAKRKGICSHGVAAKYCRACK